MTVLVMKDISATPLPNVRGRYGWPLISLTHVQYIKG